MALKRIKDLTRTVTSPKPAEYIETDHTTDGSGKLDLQEYLQRHVATRAIRECCISDGATANRCAEWTPGTSGAVAGLPISLPFELDMSESNPSATWYFVKFATNAVTGHTGADALALLVDSTGTLYISQRGPLGGSNYRELAYAGFRAAYSGVKSLRGIVVFESGDTPTAPKIYLRQTDISASFTLATAGTVPNWMPLTLNTTKLVMGYQMPSGRFVPHAPILGALTAAEVLEWTQTGRLPTWCESGTGSAVSLVATGNSLSNAATDANSDGLSASSNCTTSAQAAARTGGLGAYVARLTATAASFSARYALAAPGGTKVRITGWYRTSAGSTISAVLVGLYQSGTSSGTLLSVAASTAWAQFSTEITVGLPATSMLLGGQGATAADYVEFDDVVVQIEGPIFKPVIQPGVVIDDASSNGIAGILSTGISPITDRTDARIRGTTNTSGNQLLLGAAMLPDSYLINIRARARTGTPTVKWGAVSAGAEWVAAIALNGNWKELTMVNPSQNGSSLGNVWVNSTTADIIDTCIQIRRQN
jgi:hypothetical protein